MTRLSGQSWYNQALCKGGELSYIDFSQVVKVRTSASQLLEGNFLEFSHIEDRTQSDSIGSGNPRS